ncbi:MAG: flagellin FliC [Magnetococcus sp. DMHC-8]
MAITITSNASALRSAHTLTRTTGALNHAFDRLASGLRINQAKDDVAGFAIATRMETRIREQNKAIQNVGDAISMTQIADGGLQGGAQIMQRMQELAIQSANDTYGATDRQSMEDEFNQLKTQLQHLADHVQFNGQKLLDGSMNGRKIQIGGAEDATGMLEWLSVDGNQAQLTQREAVYSAWWATQGGTVPTPSILTQEQAEQAIGAINDAITNVATQRTRLGAFESRLHSIQDNLMQATTEVTAARSKIRDVDLALESANLASRSIIQNATTAVLAQANQQPVLAMKLLG